MKTEVIRHLNLK